MGATAISNAIKNLLIVSFFIVITVSCDDDKNNFSKIVKDPIMSGVESIGDFTRRLDEHMSGPRAHCPGCEDEQRQESPPTRVTGLNASEEKLLANYKKLGGDVRAFKQTMCFFKANKDKKFSTTGEGYSNGISIDDERYITINDMTKPSSHKRLFILDRQTGEVLAYQSSHGGGTGSQKNTRETAKNVSNQANSNLSPSGFFITGNRYVSNKTWRHGMRLHGLQLGINDKSMARGIVLHQGIGRGGPYTSGGVASSNEANPKLVGAPAGRTQGCTGVDPNHWQSIMGKLQSGVEGNRPYKGGSLYYNYSFNEKNRGDNYCGHSLVGTK